MSNLIVKRCAPLLLFFLVTACGNNTSPVNPESEQSGTLHSGATADIHALGNTQASAKTAQLNQQVSNTLPFTNRQDFEEATRGLIAVPENLEITGPDGTIVWKPADFDFIEGDAPDTVNPSLWRQAQLNNIHGLFKVADGVYQLRGFDLANMSLIAGKRGWIVVDPLTNRQSAVAAMKFAFQHLPKKPISAVLFTHSHIDHFGGVLGALEAAETSIEDARVIAPHGFLQESTSENILAGPTMMRRSDYMYGMNLPKSSVGHVGSGLGKGPSNGSVGILAPTDVIERSGQTLMIDDVEFVFQDVSGSEAPAEFTFYLPAQNAFCGAEMVSRTMHNLYTLRGAKVRDALAWSQYIDDAKNLFNDADVYFGSHHWPIWGQERIARFLEVQRDTYKFIHDQTMRLAFQGFTPLEIAEQIELPKALQQDFSNRGYYGTLRHNSRAVYQRYFGWYDGNPANLNPLPPQTSAIRYVDAMGGADKVLQLAQQAYNQGDYRWVATLLNHLVFAEPENKAAKTLLAGSYDQLGYQAESGPWRDIYLSGALELRHGKKTAIPDLANARDMIKHADRSNFFSVMAAQLDAEAAEGKNLTINFVFTDLNESHVLTVKNSVLHHRQGAPEEQANATLRISHDLFLDLVLGSASMREIIFSDQLSIQGSKIDLAKFFALQDKAEGVFSIVTP